VKPDPAARRTPTVRLALFNPAVAWTAGRFDVRLHHHAQRLHSCRKAEPLEALLNLGERFFHSSDHRSR